MNANARPARRLYPHPTLANVMVSAKRRREILKGTAK